MQNVKNRNISLFTSDYALYWFEYLAGYDAIFRVRGESSRIKHTSLCRGTANVQDEEWRAIITWTCENPPYLKNETQILQDMIKARACESDSKSKESYKASIREMNPKAYYWIVLSG